MRSRRPRPSGNGQDYDSTPAEGLQPRCLILLLATRLLSLTAPNRPGSQCFCSPSWGSAFFFLFFFFFSPDYVPTSPLVEKFPLCIWLCPAFYISLKVKLTRTTMTERKLRLHQGQDRCPIFPIFVSARKLETCMTYVKLKIEI